MKHHTKEGVPMSAPNSALLDLAVSNGYETKPLKYGVRIIGTDVVCSDVPWNGLYLCKSKGFTEADRTEFGQAKLKPSDQSCWRVCVDSLAIDPEEAKAQAMDMLTLAAKKGYMVSLAEKAGIDLEAAAPEAKAEAPTEEVAAEAAPEEPKATESPKKRSAGRRKKARKQEAAPAPAPEASAPTGDLDADLASL